MLIDYIFYKSFIAIMTLNTALLGLLHNEAHFWTGGNIFLFAQKIYLQIRYLDFDLLILCFFVFYNFIIFLVFYRF